MNIDDILDAMDEQMDKSPSVPFSAKKAVVDIEQMRDLINEIRLSLPQEIKQAKMIVQDRQIIIEDARKEADGIVKRAEDRAKIIISNEEITKQAKLKATELLTQAQGKAKEIRGATNDYVDNVLNQTEELLSSSLTDLKKTRAAIRTAKK